MAHTYCLKQFSLMSPDCLGKAKCYVLDEGIHVESLMDTTFSRKYQHRDDFPASFLQIHAAIMAEPTIF